jgi:hypothetical protein
MPRTPDVTAGEAHVRLVADDPQRLRIRYEGTDLHDLNVLLNAISSKVVFN